jgi:hypothetical protein
MSHPSDILFEKMRAVVEAPGYPLLQHYKQDFYQHDRKTLRETYAPGMSYLWVVRSHGTDLEPLHIDPRDSERALVALKYDDEARCYVVSEAGVREVSRQQAKDRLAKFDYEVRNGFVMKNGNVNLGFVEVQSVLGRGQRKVTVHFHSSTARASLTERDLVALRRIAVGQAIMQSQSLFVPCMEVTYNGESIAARAQRMEELCEA